MSIDVSLLCCLFSSLISKYLMSFNGSLMYPLCIIIPGGHSSLKGGIFLGRGISLKGGIFLVRGISLKGGIENNTAFKYS
jgi:hypothetical protein